MARFKLLEPHYIEGHYLEKETEVGTDTPFPVAVPSIWMEGLDAEGEKLVAARQKTAGYIENALPIKLKDSK